MKFEEIKEYLKEKVPKYVYYDTMGPVCIDDITGTGRLELSVEHLTVVFSKSQVGTLGIGVDIPPVEYNSHSWGNVVHCIYWLDLLVFDIINKYDGYVSKVVKFEFPYHDEDTSIEIPDGYLYISPVAMHFVVGLSNVVDGLKVSLVPPQGRLDYTTIYAYYPDLPIDGVEIGNCFNTICKPFMELLGEKKKLVIADCDGPLSKSSPDYKDYIDFLL
jgi:hypothetical protein